MGLKYFLGENGRMGGAMLTPTNFFTLGGCYVCASFGENRSRNATVRLHKDGKTDANRFYNLPHAICCSYGADKKC